MPILQMKPWRRGEVKSRASGHTARKWQDRSSDPDGPVRGSIPLALPWDCDRHLPPGGLFGSFLSLGGLRTLQTNACRNFSRDALESGRRGTPTSYRAYLLPVTSGALPTIARPAFVLTQLAILLTKQGPAQHSNTTLLTLSPTGAGRNYLLKQSNESHLPTAPGA